MSVILIAVFRVDKPDHYINQLCSYSVSNIF